MRFIEEDVRLSQDLPWINEYISVHGQEGDISVVEELILGVKGILVICKEFKGFIFRGTKTFEFLLAAMEYWKEVPQPGYALYGQALATGKIAIALEDSLDTIFTVDKKGKVTCRLKKPITGLTLEESNPFIRPVTTVPTTSRKRKATNGDTDAAEMSH